jgi:hypothetical protein
MIFCVKDFWKLVCKLGIDHENTADQTLFFGNSLFGERSF